jgi:hypothetical protein
MPIPRDARLLRMFFGEDDRADGKPLYEVLVLLARERALAGAKECQERMARPVASAFALWLSSLR